ncbi:MAG TPA: DUF2723 domain-containing protein, partial [Bacteroidetes bacterium]|nr:DUF2723 domain-containing protein [Bacteroidota bacterium]
MNRLFATEKYLPAILAMLAGLIYLLTLAPGITHTDSGELATVASTLGIAHPTGYPLWTMLGWLFTRIPGIPAAWLLNFMSLLFVAGSVYLFGRSLAYLFGQLRIKIKGEPKDKPSRVDLARIFAILIGTLFFAFGRTVWAQSTTLEVYSLHTFLLNLNLYLLLRAWFAPKDQDKPWLIFAITFALAFANHLTTVVFLPGVAWLYFSKNGFDKTAFLRIAKMLGIFFPLLILIYAYLPLRAAAEPSYNWGNPSNFDALLHHITGRQFQIWWFTGKEPFLEQFGNFFKRFSNEFGYIGILIALPGLIYSFQLRRPLAIFFLLLFLGNIFWTANYSIKDPEPYYLLALTISTLWIALGIRWIWIRLKATRNLRYGLTGLAFALLLLTLTLNYSAVNQRQTHQYEDYARAALSSLPPNSLVISGHWDGFVSPSYYLQGVEKFRTDIDIFEYKIMRNRHWYPHFIRVNFPEVAAHLGPRLDQWETSVQDFDLHGNVNPALLGQRFQALCFGLFEEMKNRPVYISPEMLQDDIPVPPGLVPVPERYFYRILP